MPHSPCVYRRFALPVLLVALAAASSFAALPAAASVAELSRPSGGYVRVIVALRRDSSPRSLAAVIGAVGARQVRVIRSLRVVAVRVPRENASVLVARLAKSDAVRHVERDRTVLRVTASNAVQATPSDPLWGQQWGAALTDAPTAWAVTKGSPNVVVAVLDSGVDFSHPDLQGALVPGYDFVNNDADPTDDNGHGTGVAGIVGARSDNGRGVSGFCPRCSVMPVKVVGSDGSASGLNVASGITWAADHGARVISLSLGGTYSSTVSDAVRYVSEKGVLVVAAAGNNGNSNLFYPAAEPGVVSVAATQRTDQLFSWSNFGDWVAVAAPGCDMTTIRGGRYGEFCGTSAATPVVSGLAGLAMSYAPDASADKVRQAITGSSHRVGGVAYGRVDVAGVLAALGATFRPAPAPVPPAAPPASPKPTASAAPSPPRPTVRSGSRVRRAAPPRRSSQLRKSLRKKHQRRAHRARHRVPVELSRRGD
jgi:subtilisin family serine protease